MESMRIISARTLWQKALPCACAILNIYITLSFLCWVAVTIYAAGSIIRRKKILFSTFAPIPRVLKYPL
jgi:hypothetical protein